MSRPTIDRNRETTPRQQRLNFVLNYQICMSRKTILTFYEKKNRMSVIA